ncbi:MAG: hypothetical protein QM704_19920 [Anaeromyxobacteraceae bacterium]
MYARTERPLTEAEQRRLRRQLARKSRRSLASPRPWIASLVVFGVLWAATVLATGRVLWPTVLWGAAALLMPLWMDRDERLEARARRRRLEGALAANRAEEHRVTATAAVLLEEVEDLGEAWAFQVEPDRLLLLGPRQALPRGFPSDDFSYTKCRDAEGAVVEEWFTLRGEPLAPARRIPAAVQPGLAFPGELELLEGRLDRLEDLLRPARSITPPRPPPPPATAC